MRLTRAAACRSFAACLLALTTVSAPAFAQRSATVLELAAQQKNLTTFVAAVHAAGLDDTLKAAGPFTIYAPTDEAFAKIPAADRDALMHDSARLKALLMRHVVNDMVLMNDGNSRVTSGSIPSAGGSMLTFGDDGDRATVNGARVVVTDLRADNGAITTIDKVLLT